MVSVIYDLQYVFYPQFFDQADIRERERNAQRALRLATKVVCISDYVRRTVLDHFGADPAMVETIHITAPRRLARPQPGDRRTLATFGLKHDDYLLYPANFWLHKNHELLLAAYEQYRSRNPLSELKLVFTGAPGMRRDRLIDLCRRKGLSEQVVFP